MGLCSISSGGEWEGEILRNPVGWVQACLRWLHILSQGLDFGQGGGRQVMVVMRHGSGKDQSLVQGIAGLGAGVKWVGCWWWEGCQESNGRGVLVPWDVRQVLVVMCWGGGKNCSPVQGMAGLVAGVRWVRCWQWRHC